MLEYAQLPIGGSWVESTSSTVLKVFSPSTEEQVGSVPDGTTADIDRAVGAARKAFTSGPWAHASPAERAAPLAAAAAILDRRRGELAELLANEVGVPMRTTADRQVGNAIAFADYMSSLATTFSFEEERQGLAQRLLVRHVPLGVVGAIVPWNVPLFIAVSKITTALAAGCTVVLKPSPETPLNAFVLAEIFAEAGLPDGVFNVVPAGREVSEYLVTHPGVDKISFTGSTSVGKRIASLCGADLRRVTLELGGKSAAVLLDDVDVSDVVARLAPLTTMNNGQTCINQTRIIAPRKLYAEVVEAVTAAYAAMRVGDPLAEGTDVGPLISETQRERVEGFIASGREQGARLTIGGGRPDRATGWFVQPTVFADVDNAMRIAQEEIFGPVVSVLAHDGDDDAVRIANDSVYGLSGTVWTTDPDRGVAVAKRVRTGTIAVNDLERDLGAPFGGFKQSGIGREYGPEGLSAFCEYQSLALPA